MPGDTTRCTRLSEAMVSVDVSKGGNRGGPIPPASIHLAPYGVVSKRHG
jgi:hypothetical protein